MKPATKVMPVAATFTALSTLACCLPVSLSAAIGIAAIGAALAPYRNWLTGVSGVFLAIGVLQLYRFKRTCRKNSVSGIAVMALAGVIVLGVSLFPQVIAVAIAELFP
jgi:hypothetical protein